MCIHITSGVIGAIVSFGLDLVVSLSTGNVKSLLSYLQYNMNSSSMDDGENIDQALSLNREIATRITSLKRKCFDFKVLGPIELSRRSNPYNRTASLQVNRVSNRLAFSSEQQELMIQELSCRLNIQGLTVEQFLTGRIDISAADLITILINKLKYPSQYSARRTARFIFEMTPYDSEEKRQIDDILFQFKKKLECSSYSHTTGKQLFQTLRLKIRTLFYHKIVNGRPIDYHSLSRYLFSEGLDMYQISQLLSYILECSPSSSFHWFQLKSIVMKEAPSDSSKKGKYEKKESILTKSSDDPEHTSLGQGKGVVEQISFSDCEIEVIEACHQPHRCGVYN